MAGFTGIKNNETEENQSGAMQKRIFLLMIICGIGIFAFLTVRLFDNQVLRHEELELRAIEQQTRDTPISAARGTIFDRNGKPLAVSSSVETVYIDPYEIRSYGESGELIALKLSEILGIDYVKTYEMTQKTGTRYQTIKRKIEAEEAAAVRAFIADPDGNPDTKAIIRSVHLEPDTKRYYPRGSLAAQVIGFVGTDNDGLYGVEATFNKYLTGTDGRVVRLKDGSGTEMLFNDYENYFDATNGSNITLTLDATIQHYMEKHLEQAVIDYGVKQGAAAIAMDPNTGGILGMVTLGNFDLNNAWALSEAEEERVSQVVDDPATEDNEAETERRNALFSQWRNRLLSDTYEPGSVFKTIILAIALEEDVVSESDTFFCGGSMDVLGRENALHCHKRTGHGQQTLSEAVQNSCNIAFTNIGMRIGADLLYEYFEAFGLFSKTGIDLIGETSSLWWTESVFKNPKDLSSVAAASFGQTFNITPLQLVTAISASINGGYLNTPHVVGEITDGDDSIVMQPDLTPVRQVISAETSATVRKFLENVVKDGSGGNARVTGYRVGGKTGTSEKTAQNAAQGEGTQKQYIVSFCGVAPMENPQIVILVLLDDPSSNLGVAIYGSTMAAPVVGKMLADILPYLNVTPQYTEEELKTLNTAVPKLTGKPLEEAKTALRNLGLEYKIIGGGDTVTAQLPNANATVVPGTCVIIYTEGKPSQEITEVPNLTGRSYANAKSVLEEYGLFISSSGVPIGTSGAVVSVQSAAAGETVAYGSVIEVVLVDNTLVDHSR